MGKLEKFQKKILGIFIWVIPFLFGLLLQITDSLDNLEESTIDLRYKYFNPNHKISDQIAILSIDNDSLKDFSDYPEFGRWPWNRSVYVPVVELIAKQKPKIILFDILFTEPSKDDEMIVEFNQKYPNVSHTLFLHREESSNTTQKNLEYLYRNIEYKVKELEDCDNQFSDIIPPAKNIGISSPVLHALGDRRIGDRMNKEELLVYNYKKNYFLSLPLAAYNHLHPIQKIFIQSDKLLLHTNSKKFNIPLNKCYFNYHYYKKSELQRIPNIPYNKFLFLFDKEKPKEIALNIFHNKIVLIGVTATSIYDEKITPFGNMPSVFLNTMAISNILKEHFLYGIPLWIVLIISLFLSALSVFFMFFFKRSFYRAFLPFVFLNLYIFMSILLFRFDYSLNLSFFLVFYPFSYVISLGYITFIEGRENHKLVQESMFLNHQLVAFNEKLEEKIKERTSELIKEKENSEKIMLELKARNDAIEKELDKARKIHTKLLPQKYPNNFEYSFFSYYQPMDKVGGDLYGFVELPSNELGVFILDVTGHGIPAAFISSMFKYQLETTVSNCSSPAKALEQLNDLLCNSIQDYLITLFYLVLKSNGDIICSNAGHTYPFLYKRKTNNLFELKTKGRILGINFKKNWKNYRFQMEPGDRLFLYTDGITEAGTTEIFGEERLIEIILKYKDLDGDMIVKKIIEGIGEFLNSKNIEDDITLLMIEKKS